MVRNDHRVSAIKGTDWYLWCGRTFAEEVLGLNIQRNCDLKRLWRDIFNSGGSNGRSSVLSAEVDWKCKLFPVEMSMNLSQVCLIWERSMEGKTNLFMSDVWLESILRYCTEVNALFAWDAMFGMTNACCYAPEYNLQHSVCYNVGIQF